MKKRCFLIIGAESSGTRVLAQSFISSDVFGDGGHAQRLDFMDDEGLIEIDYDVVFRRSLPHAGEWPVITEIVERFTRTGFKVVVVGILRETSFVINSQLRNSQHSDNVTDASEKIQRANRLVNDYAETIVEYTPFVNSEEYRNSFFADYFLPPPSIYYYDGNQKYK